ncbi:dna repair protein-like protein rad18 [Lophiostoma macrostomum CBS 122681]|uniref:Dna repair protein-like protein rad18 n=1 Tax=Lophiostoma macrostomum CBS 122681 TaxID=1314788 RepID=A0A6A6TF17_9PLEO|nr:dna repair protein-like protein rad18 [Lophiostoma macrostomum CBS 122681]
MAQVLPAKRQHAFEDGISSYNRASQHGREKRPRYSVRDVSNDATSSSSSEDESESESERPGSEQPALDDNGDGNEDALHQAQTQHTIYRLQNREHKVNRPSESGVIEEINCTNFMCHKRLTVTLGPLINFIIGHNGSGKSAVLAALTICLAGKATATSRGQNLKSFIKEGEDYCVLSVKIKNQGMAAYKPELFGQSIIVERHFNKSGTSGYKLKDEKKKIVSTKKQAVEDVLNAFALDFDNPMNILTQDEARQFLNTSDPSKKYKFFLKGTQLETLQQDYNLIKTELDEMLSKTEVYRADIEQLNQIKNKAKEKAKRAEKLENMRARESLLRELTAWAKVEVAEKDLKDNEEEIRHVDELIEKTTAAADEESMRFERENHMYSEANQAIQDRDAELQPMIQEHDDVLASFQETKRALLTINTTEREITQKLTSKTKLIEKYRAQVEEHRQRQAEADNGQHAQKVAELEEAKYACDRALKSLEEHINQVEDLNKDLKQAHEERQTAGEKYKEKQAQVQRSKLNVEQLQRGERNWIDAYPVPTTLSKLLSAMERQKGQFVKPPVGPMGRYIKLLKPEWSSILEKQSGSSLNAFVVTTKSDQVLLSRMMQQHNCNGYPIYIGQGGVIDTTPHEPDQTLNTWLRVLNFDNNMVRNQMIINHQIDQAVLIQSRAEAEEFMHNDGELRKNVKMCFTFADRDKTKGHSITGNTITGSVNLGPIDSYIGSPRMQADKEQRIQAARQHLDRFTQEAEQATEEQRVAQGSLIACKNRLDQYEKRKRNLKLKHQQTQDDVERLEAELSAATPDAGMIELLEESMQAVQLEKDLEAGQYQDLIVQKDKLNAENRTNKDTLDAASRRIAEMNVLLGKERTKADRAKNKRDDALKRKNDALEAVKKAEENKIGWEQHKGEILTTLEEWTSDALQICARMPIPAGKTPAILDKDFQRQQREIEDAEKSLGGSEGDLLAVANEAKRKWESAVNEVAAINNVTRRLEQSLDKRNQRWRMFRSYISVAASSTFGYLLAVRRFRGELKADHSKQCLDIHVQPDSTEASGAGRQTKTLSGGEKSFSTICLLLSLWDAMGSPIRCLDEFDVFMDNANRSVAMNMIILGARNANGRQFIFITPQSMQDVQSADDVKIIRMTDPERGQTALNVRSQRA